MKRRRIAALLALTVLALSEAGCGSAVPQIMVGGSPIGAVTAITCPSAMTCLALGSTTKRRRAGTYELASSDAGRTWRVTRHPPILSTPTALACSDAVHCVALGADGAALTTDAGVRWSALTLPVDPQAISSAPPGTCVAVGPSTGVPHPIGSAAVSTNGGATWSVYPLGPLALHATQVGCLTAAHCLAFGPSGVASPPTVVLGTTDGGVTWTSVPAPPIAALHVACGGGTTSAVTSSTWQIETSHDGGSTWARSTVHLPPDFLAAPGTGPGACSDDRHCVFTTELSVVMVTAEGGTTFAPVALPPHVGSSAVWCSPAGLCLTGGSDNGVVGLGGAIARSTDAGGHWTQAWRVA